MHGQRGSALPSIDGLEVNSGRMARVTQLVEGHKLISYAGTMTNTVAVQEQTIRGADGTRPPPPFDSI